MGVAEASRSQEYALDFLLVFVGLLVVLSFLMPQIGNDRTPVGLVALRRIRSKSGDLNSLESPYEVYLSPGSSELHSESPAKARAKPT